MKGIVNIEFILSIVVFLTVISFVTITIINNIPVFEGEFINNKIKMRGYQISYILLFDEGFPKNWSYENILRFGLSSGNPYFINNTKILELEKYCNKNYTDFRKMVNGNIRLNFSYMNETTMIYCRGIEGKERFESTINRFAVDDNNRIIRLSITIEE